MGKYDVMRPFGTLGKLRVNKDINSTFVTTRHFAYRSICQENSRIKKTHNGKLLNILNSTEQMLTNIDTYMTTSI